MMVNIRMIMSPGDTLGHQSMCEAGGNDVAATMLQQQEQYGLPEPIGEHASHELKARKTASGSHIKS